MINAKIREFENDIINYVNLCEDVPIEAKYLVFKDILQQIKEEANRQVTVEREQMKLAKERESEDDIRLILIRPRQTERAVMWLHMMPFMTF
jgi:hypothetical protein